MSPDAVLLDQFLAHLESRREETQRRFDELTLRRASMSALERNLARDSLRTQAAALMDELRRLKLVAALTRGVVEAAAVRIYARSARSGRARTRLLFVSMNPGETLTGGRLRWIRDAHRVELRSSQGELKVCG